MLNKKGFTLVELLVVLLILASISLITVNGISASLERQKDNECDNQKEIVKNAAKIYFSLQNDPKSASSNGVTIEKLIQEDYFEEKDVNRLSKSYTVKLSGNSYVISGNCN